MAPTTPKVFVTEAHAPTQMANNTSKPVHNSNKHLSAPSTIDYGPSRAALAKRRKVETDLVKIEDIQVPKFTPFVKRIEYLWNEGRLSRVQNKLPSLFVKIESGEISARKAADMI